MSFSIFLHPDVEDYLDSLHEKEKKRCYDVLKKLSKGPFKSRSGCDIKKMSGKKRFLQT